MVSSSPNFGRTLGASLFNTPEEKFVENWRLTLVTFC